MTEDEWNRIQRIRLVPTPQSDILDTALMLSMFEMDKVRLQIRRTNADRAVGVASFTRDSVVEFYADMQLLIYCISRLGRLVKFILRFLPTEPELRKVWNRQRKTFGKAKDFRDGLEHIDERVEQGVRDLGALSQGKLILAGKEFECNPDLEMALESFFAEFLEACESVATRQSR